MVLCTQPNQVSAYFTSVQILSIEFAVTSKEAVTSAKIKYIGLLDLQVSKYGLLAALWQLEMGRQLKSSKCLIYQGADNAYYNQGTTTTRGVKTAVKQHWLNVSFLPESPAT